MPRPPEQFDLFAKPQRKSGGGEPLPPPSPEEPVADGPYEPTPADEQALLEMDHGPGVQYLPPKSRSEREAEKRRRQAMHDDALGRLGVPGKQLLTDEESPFARGAREEEKRKPRKS